MEGNNPLTQGLNERILILREQDKTGPARDPDANVQLTLNYQPQLYPEGGLAGSMTLVPGARESWRLLNATSKQFLSLQLTYGATLQQFEVLAIDGVQLSTPMFTTTLNIPPAGRMEFIVPGLPAGTVGNFHDQRIRDRLVGDTNNPQVLAKLSTGTLSQQQQQQIMVKAQRVVKPPTQPVRFAGLSNLPPTITRRLDLRAERRHQRQHAVLPDSAGPDAQAVHAG